MKKIKYSQIVDILNKNSIDVSSNLNGDETFDQLTSISNAKENDLCFFSNIKYLDDLKFAKAKACIINPKFSEHLPKNCIPIEVSDPYLSLAYIIEIFNKNKITSNGIISELATLDKNLKIHDNVQIDSYSCIKDDVEIFDNVIVGSNTSIGPEVILGKNSIIHNNVSISNAIISEGCEIKPGARIGFSGFGFEEKSKKKILHVGNVIIGKNTTIGSNTTIDRAVFESTIIGEHSQIDNLVQIAHNVSIGKHAIIAAQVGIAGSVSIGDNVKIGGQAGVAGHLTIGNNVTIAGKSGVTKNIQDNKIVAGFPAKDINHWKRDVINISRKK